MVKEMECLSLRQPEMDRLEQTDCQQQTCPKEEMPCAREEMIQKNMGLVHACAHRFQGRGIEYEDLFQAGCMGLIKATDAFDWSRGVRFSTYAVPVILGEMRRLFRDGGTVKVSRTLKELSIRVMRERERYYAQNGKEATIHQLAERMGETVEDIVEAIGAAAPAMSLTGSDEEDGQSSQIDIPVESQEERITDLLALREVMGSLSPKDRSLIVCRYFQGKTQNETAKLLGMTQVQVSRREKKILQSLRRGLEGG